MEQEIKDDAAKAEMICPRIEPTKSAARLDKDITVYEKRIAEEQQGKRTIQQITKLFKEAKKGYQETNNYITKLTEFCTKLRSNLQLRAKMWATFRKSIEKRTKILFNVYLSQKGFAGNMVFDHEKQTIDIMVQLDSMDAASNKSTMQNTKALSGGERSYSTVSLLLALWEAMECPFRAMDEFDVFMDAVNRKISIDLLLKCSSQNQNRQFIFITPHDFSQIQLAEGVKIVKMHPPERGGQRTIEETINN